MENLGYIGVFRGDNTPKSEYEFISETIYEKERSLFNQIYDYLVKEFASNPSAVISLEDMGIKNILRNSKEIDLQSSEYRDTLIEWIDKYNEDYIDRFGGKGFKFYLYDNKFALTRYADDDINNLRQSNSKISPIASNVSVSIVDLFKSLSPTKLSESEAKRVSKINKNLRKIAAMF